MKTDVIEWLYLILLALCAILLFTFIIVGPIVSIARGDYRIELVDELSVNVEKLTYLDCTPEGIYIHGTAELFDGNAEIKEYINTICYNTIEPRYFRIGKAYYCVVPNTLTYENYGEK